MASPTAVASTHASEAAPNVTLAELWTEFRRTQDPNVRCQLVLHYAGLVRYAVSQLGRDLPASVDFDDLAQAGFVGLMAAVDRFQPDLGVKFETYAVVRIRGAIVDDMRAQDWAPRSLRARARAQLAAEQELEHRLQRLPTDAEVAEALGQPTEAVVALREQVHRAKVAALDEMLADGGDGERPRLADTLFDPTAPGVDERLLEEDTRATVQRALAALPDRDRQVLVLSFAERLTLRQVGMALGVTESRACQLRTRALGALREILSADEALAASAT